MFKNNGKNFGPGKHPASQANLKKWKSGESGNPGGRPKKYKKLNDDYFASYGSGDLDIGEFSEFSLKPFNN